MLDFFGRREWPDRELVESKQEFIQQINKFNQILAMRKDEQASIISLITCKLNFSYEEAKSLTLEDRKLYLKKIEEMFSKKNESPENQKSMRKK